MSSLVKGLLDGVYNNISSLAWNELTNAARDVLTPGLCAALLPEGQAPNRRDDRIVEILTIRKDLLSLRGSRPFEVDAPQQSGQSTQPLSPALSAANAQRLSGARGREGVRT